VELIYFVELTCFPLPFELVDRSKLVHEVEEAELAILRYKAIAFL